MTAIHGTPPPLSDRQKEGEDRRKKTMNDPIPEGKKNPKRDIHLNGRISQTAQYNCFPIIFYLLIKLCLFFIQLKSSRVHSALGMTYDWLCGRKGCTRDYTAVLDIHLLFVAIIRVRLLLIDREWKQRNEANVGCNAWNWKYNGASESKNHYWCIAPSIKTKISPASDLLALQYRSKAKYLERQNFEGLPTDINIDFSLVHCLCTWHIETTSLSLIWFPLTIANDSLLCDVDARTHCWEGVDFWKKIFFNAGIFGENKL